MNFILAVLFSFFSDYVIMQGIENKPLIETSGIIGGNLVLYIKTQQQVGKLLLQICFKMKTKHESDTIEMVEIKK